MYILVVYFAGSNMPLTQASFKKLPTSGARTTVKCLWLVKKDVEASNLLALYSGNHTTL